MWSVYLLWRRGHYKRQCQKKSERNSNITLIPLINIVFDGLFRVCVCLYSNRLCRSMHFEKCIECMESRDSVTQISIRPKPFVSDVWSLCGYFMASECQSITICVFFLPWRWQCFDMQVLRSLHEVNEKSFSLTRRSLLQRLWLYAFCVCVCVCLFPMTTIIHSQA